MSIPNNNIGCKGNGFFAKKCSNHIGKYSVIVLFY